MSVTEESRLAGAAEPSARERDIEELTNLYVVHPVASGITRLLARTSVSPNAVSLAGMLCGLSAGIAYRHDRNLSCVAAGLLLMILWHVLDGVDGQLARLTHRQSELGKVLDGVCDYVTFAAVYVGLGIALGARHGAWIWGLIAVAGLCHATQAAAYEVQRQDYLFWGLGRHSAQLINLDAMPQRHTASAPRRLIDRLHRLYGRLQLFAAGVDLASRRRLAARLALQPGQAAVIRQRYRLIFAPGVRQFSLMSANYRTLAIFVFAAAKLPLGYFLFEIFGLTGLLITLLAAQRSRYRHFTRSLEAEGQGSALDPSRASVLRTTGPEAPDPHP